MTTTNSQPGLPDIDLAAPLSTDQDVLCRVDRLLGQELGPQRSIVLMFLSDDGVQLPVIVPIDDVPERPDDLHVGDLCGVIVQVLEQVEEAGSAVVTLCRRGSEIVDEADRHWFRVLHDAARARGAAIRMFCLATPAGVRQLTVDDAG